MVIDEREVRERYRAAGHNGVVALIDFLAESREQGDEVVKIGSATIFGDPTKKPCVLDAFKVIQLGSFHFGTPTGKCLPIEEIADLNIALFESHDSHGHSILDAICADFARRDGSALQVMLSKSVLTRPFNPGLYS